MYPPEVPVDLRERKRNKEKKKYYCNNKTVGEIRDAGKKEKDKCILVCITTDGQSQ